MAVRSVGGGVHAERIAELSRDELNELEMWLRCGAIRNEALVTS